MRKAKTPSFALTLPLAVEPWQADKLNKDFRIACIIYNMLLGDVRTRYRQMIKTKRYRRALNSYRTQRKKAPYKDILNTMRTEYRLTKHQIEANVAQYQHYYKQIHSQVAQKIAYRINDSLEKLLYSDGKQMHFCAYDNFCSIEGKSNHTGIRFVNGEVVYGKMKLKPMINFHDTYIQQAMSCRVKYCRLKRSFVRGRWKFYVQLILEGHPPIKVNADGTLQNNIEVGSRVGLDIGPQTLAICSDSTVKLVELADKVQNIEDQLRLINRAMDRSRRATNPEHFNKDGTVKRGCKNQWSDSNRYLKLKSIKRELYRKQAAIRKIQHYELARFVLSIGNEVYVESMSFKGLQRRTKKTQKNSRGKYKSKKRFGKSIANRAPAMFLSILQNKLQESGGHLYKINTKEVKASQYNHETNAYESTALSKRIKTISGNKVQRDLYSAFLIKNVKPNLSEIDRTACIQSFDNFLILHNEEVSRLKQQNTYTLSSMGIKEF